MELCRRPCGNTRDRNKFDKTEDNKNSLLDVCTDSQPAPTPKKFAKNINCKRKKAFYASSVKKFKIREENDIFADSTSESDFFYNKQSDLKKCTTVCKSDIKAGTKVPTMKAKFTLSPMTNICNNNKLSQRLPSKTAYTSSNKNNIKRRKKIPSGCVPSKSDKDGMNMSPLSNSSHDVSLPASKSKILDNQEMLTSPSFIPCAQRDNELLERPESACTSHLGILENFFSDTPPPTLPPEVPRNITPIIDRLNNMSFTGEKSLSAKIKSTNLEDLNNSIEFSLTAGQRVACFPARSSGSISSEDVSVSFKLNGQNTVSERKISICDMLTSSLSHLQDDHSLNIEIPQIVSETDLDSDDGFLNCLEKLPLSSSLGLQSSKLLHRPEISPLKVGLQSSKPLHRPEISPLKVNSKKYFKNSINELYGKSSVFSKRNVGCHSVLKSCNQDLMQFYENTNDIALTSAQYPLAQNNLPIPHLDQSSINTNQCLGLELNDKKKLNMEINNNCTRGSQCRKAVQNHYSTEQKYFDNCSSLSPSGTNQPENIRSNCESSSSLEHSRSCITSEKVKKDTNCKSDTENFQTDYIDNLFKGDCFIESISNESLREKNFLQKTHPELFPETTKVNNTMAITKDSCDKITKRNHTKITKRNHAKRTESNHDLIFGSNSANINRRYNEEHEKSNSDTIYNQDIICDYDANVKMIIRKIKKLFISKKEECLGDRSVSWDFTIKINSVDKESEKLRFDLNLNQPSLPSTIKYGYLKIKGKRGKENREFSHLFNSTSTIKNVPGNIEVSNFGLNTAKHKNRAKRYSTDSKKSKANITVKSLDAGEESDADNSFRKKRISKKFKNVDINRANITPKKVFRNQKSIEDCNNSKFNMRPAAESMSPSVEYDDLDLCYNKNGKIILVKSCEKKRVGSLKSGKSKDKKGKFRASI